MSSFSLGFLSKANSKETNTSGLAFGSTQSKFDSSVFNFGSTQITSRFGSTQPITEFRSTQSTTDNFSQQNHIVHMNDSRFKDIFGDIDISNLKEDDILSSSNGNKYKLKIDKSFSFFSNNKYFERVDTYIRNQLSQQTIISLEQIKQENQDLVTTYRDEMIEVYERIKHNLKDIAARGVFHCFFYQKEFDIDSYKNVLDGVEYEEYHVEEEMFKIAFQQVLEYIRNDSSLNVNHIIKYEGSKVIYKISLNWF